MFVKTASTMRRAIKSIADELQALYAQRNMKVTAITTGPGDRLRMDSQFAIVVYMFLGMAFLAALVGGIGQMGALSIGVIERTKEIGILRAIGARSRTIIADVHAGRNAAGCDKLARGTAHLACLRALVREYRSGVSCSAPIWSTAMISMQP